MDLYGPYFSDSRDPMTIFADSGRRFSILNTLKKPWLRVKFYAICPLGRSWNNNSSCGLCFYLQVWTR